jgi:hypothetical protein
MKSARGLVEESGVVRIEKNEQICASWEMLEEREKKETKN